MTGHFTVKKWAKVVHTLDQANPSCEYIARLSSADGRKPIFDRLFAYRRISDDEKFRGSAAVTV